MTSGSEWIDQARRVLDALRGTSEDASQDPHSTDCRWCPVCQVTAVVRGERPELTAALADVLTATATALRAFAAEAAPPAESEAAHDEPTEDEPPATVQRIDIA